TRAIAAVSGSSREIYDYLAQEAFARQGPAVQEFLLATGALARFSAELADALLESSMAGEIIERLDRSHLFLVQLDGERRWYRYHHLFGEFLQRVAAERDPARLAQVHRRAARLWEARDEIDEALAHYAASGEWSEVARLLARIGPELISQGRFDTARRLLERVPPDLWQAFPQLYLTMGLVHIVSGHRDAAERFLREALVRLREAGDTEGEAITAYWVAGIWKDVDPDRLLSLADDLAGRLETFPPGARSRALTAVGYALEHRGRLDDAAAAWHRAIESAEESGRLVHSADAWRAAAKSLHRVGRFEEAIRVLQDLADRTRRHGMSHDEAHIRLDLADTAFDLGRPEEGARHLVAVRDLAAIVPCRVLAFELSVIESRAAAARGDHAEAARQLERALAEARRPVFQRPALMARLLLSESLERIDPARAQAIAEEILRSADRMDALQRTQAVLTLAVAGASFDGCRAAAGDAARYGAHHLHALALVRAAQFAPDDERQPAVEGAQRALIGLSDDGRRFVIARTAEVVHRLGIRLPGMPEQALATLAMQCLGPFELRRNGKPVPAAAWPRAASRRLLQYLTVCRRAVTREQVMEALWPGSDPARAANQLRVALSALRRVLEPSQPPRRPSVWLRAQGGEVSLIRERWEIDLDQFTAAIERSRRTAGEPRLRALQEAVELYQGDLLEDAPYEEWAAPERERLLQLYLDAAAALAEAEVSSGRWPEALDRWRAVIAKAPADERAWRGVIRAYAAMDRRAEAIQAFEQCRAALADLGVGPSPETLHLRETIASPV
ncbi:MAG TPA: BTAD domain-containing putative transcriptional regulator, partial [bacterium]|nr:BTAD domain-containing putative transcriptional regulator [bacterium]